MVRRSPRPLAAWKSGTVIGRDSTGVPQDALKNLCGVCVAGVMKSPHTKDGKGTPLRHAERDPYTWSLRGTGMAAGPTIISNGIIPAVWFSCEVSMANEKIRVGLIGAGANTRLRHIPGL